MGELITKEEKYKPKRHAILKNYLILKDDYNKFLCGEVYADSRFEDGHRLLTSYIIKEIDFNCVLTDSGTEYILCNKITKEEFIERVKNKYKEKFQIEYFLNLFDKYEVVE